MHQIVENAQFLLILSRRKGHLEIIQVLHFNFEPGDIKHASLVP
jgi:hypothetical protein